ncbi:MAG: calcium-binding protein [Tateyamaria sp.]
MTTDARILRDAVLVDGGTVLTTDFSINFDPIITIEQEVDTARNFVRFGLSEGLLLNDGFVRDYVSGNGEADIVVSNSGFIGSSGRADIAIALGGTGQRVILNEGEVTGRIQLGLSEDLVYNTGLMDGDVNTSGGNDIVFQAASGEITGRLHTGAGDDVVFNSGVIGTVNLGSGDDLYVAVTDGGNTPDGGRILGGTGDDTIRAGTTDDVIVGGDGSDEVFGSDGNDRLYGNDGKDLLNGGEGEDTLIGGDGKDTLSGGNDNDTLHGGNGEDRLFGGRGDDRLTGGSGSDIFIFNGRSGDDTITDFTSDDQVRLSQVFRFFEVDGELQLRGLITFDIVDAALDYSGNTAVLDLQAVYEAADLADRTNGQGNSITFFNVADNSLTEDNFIL